MSLHKEQEGEQKWKNVLIVIIIIIIITRRYSPLFGLSSSSCGRLWPSAEAFFALRAKKRAYYAVLAHFWHLLVSSSNLGNF